MKSLVFLFLCFHYNSLRADFTGDSFGKIHNLYDTGHVYPVIPTNCSILLDSFADYASNFTKCSIQNARPVRICESCIKYYLNFRTQYEKLESTMINGTSCKSFFISHDRLDVLLGYHDSILAVWERGQCNTCFDWNGTTPVLSSNTINFNKKFNETKNCIDEQNQITNNTEEICEKCMMSYIQLDEYYKSLSSDSIGVFSICMDIVDSMNTTRLTWSKTLGCCKLRKSPETIFLVCSGIISILPLLYYVAVRYCGPIRDLPNVLKQSRFKQRFFRKGHVTIN